MTKTKFFKCFVCERYLDTKYLSKNQDTTTCKKCFNKENKIFSDLMRGLGVKKQ